MKGLELRYYTITFHGSGDLSGSDAFEQFTAQQQSGELPRQMREVIILHKEKAEHYKFMFDCQSESLWDVQEMYPKLNSTVRSDWLSYWDSWDIRKDLGSAFEASLRGIVSNGKQECCSLIQQDFCEDLIASISPMVYIYQHRYGSRSWPSMRHNSNEKFKF